MIGWGCCSWHNYQFCQAVKAPRRSTCIGAVEHLVLTKGEYGQDRCQRVGKLQYIHRLDLPRLLRVN